jgi:integrase
MAASSADKYINIRSYCYRWSGECKCKTPCKYFTESIMLNASFDKTIDVEKQLEEFKKKKLEERDEILNILSPSAAATAKSMNSYQIIMKDYMKHYLDYVGSTDSDDKNILPNTNEALREYAKLSFELNPYITRISKLSDITIKNYNKFINTISEKYTTDTKESFVNPITLAKYPIDIYNLLKTHYKQTAVVSMLSAIIWRLRKAIENKEEGIEPIDIYIYTLIQKDAHTIRNKYEQEIAGKLTEKEQKNFIDWDTILETRNKMEETLDTSKYQDFMDFVIVSLYTYNPPIRADYANMRIFIFDDDIPLDYKDNYCVIDSSKPRFVFWKYKTATGKEPAIIDIPDELIGILFKWLEVNTSEYLLATKKGKTYLPMTENTLSVRVKSIFKRWTGRDSSINTLRHAFVSYNSRNDQIIREKEENARKMMHSSSMADKYRRYIY